MGVRRNEPMGLGIFVVERLTELGLTQRQLAEQSGLSEGEISRIVSAERKNPGGATLVKLARGLGVTVDTLLNPQDADVPNKGQKKEKKTRTVAGTGDARKRTATT